MSRVLLVAILVGVTTSGGVAQTRVGPLLPVAGAGSASTLPDPLLQHFRDRRIVLKRQVLYGGDKTEWVLEDADVGPRCEVVTSFVSFPSGTDATAMRNHLMLVSVPSALNERARLAMFHPHARGKSSDSGDCQAWSVKSRPIADQLIDAFTSYQPSVTGKVPDKKR